MKVLYSIVLLAVVAMTAISLAQESETTKANASPAKACKCCTVSTDVASDGALASDQNCEGECPVAAAMAELPKMTYTVGTESTCCSHSAAELATSSGNPIHYVVADKTYEDKTEAFTALVESTESFVNAFVTPAQCEKSGTTTVAGKSCGCPVEAGKRAELVSTAISEIKMTYKVGDEEACCPNSAAAMAKATGAETHYLVNGEETSCNLTARLKLATAKYAAAVKAISAADQSAGTQPPKTETEVSGT
jgi:hypothetical protein